MINDSQSNVVVDSHSYIRVGHFLACLVCVALGSCLAVEKKSIAMGNRDSFLGQKSTC